MVKSGEVQRESDGVVVPAGRSHRSTGKGPDFGHASSGDVRQGMAGTAQPNDSGRPIGPAELHRLPPVDRVRRLQRKLWTAAKQSRTRRFHALFDRIFRADILGGGVAAGACQQRGDRGRCDHPGRRGGIRRGPPAGGDRRTAAIGSLSSGSQPEGADPDRNPVLRGWGNYFRTGNAAQKFNQLDTCVWRRLHGLLVKRYGRNLHAGRADAWTRQFFWDLGLHRLRGTIQYPQPRSA